MRVLGSFAVLFYSLVCLTLGFSLVLLAFNTVPLSQLEDAIELAYVTPDIRYILGAVGIGIILIGLIVAHITSDKFQREKTIAFENPDGQVTVSLSAIEDLIKKISRQIPEIKELRPAVVATKKGVNILNRVVLFSGVNIPEVTEKIQNVIKAKVQDMLGIEEPISVKVHVAKISSSEKQKDEKEKEQEKEEPPRAFKGIEYSSD